MWEIMTAPISPEDVDFELDPDSLNTMKEFEVAWRNFMCSHPELVPEGKREKRIVELQKTVRGLEKAQVDAEEELQKQLDFFESNRDGVEKDLQNEIDHARAKQAKTHTKLKTQLDSIAASEHLLSQAYPWEHFLTAVDRAAASSKVKDPSGSAGKGKKAKPSTRALYLVDDTAGDARDVELRAYQIDHALLNTHVKMLQKEAEGYEKLLDTQGTLKRFLRDCDVEVPSSSSRSTATSEVPSATSKTSKTSKTSRTSKATNLAQSILACRE